MLHGGICLYRLLRTHVEESIAQHRLANGTLQFCKHLIGGIDSHRVGITDGEREIALLPILKIRYLFEGVFFAEHLRHGEAMNGTTKCRYHSYQHDGKP